MSSYTIVEHFPEKMDNIQKRMPFVLCILFISLLRAINEKLSKFIATETALSKIRINSFIPLQL